MWTQVLDRNRSEPWAGEAVAIRAQDDEDDWDDEDVDEDDWDDDDLDDDDLDDDDDWDEFEEEFEEEEEVLPAEPDDDEW